MKACGGDGTGTVVKHRSITITVYPVKHHSGAVYHRFKKIDGGKITRSTLAAAKSAALEHAKKIARQGRVDFDKLTTDQLRAIERILEADPTCRLVDEFLIWHDKRVPKKRAGEAIAEFLAAKEQARGLSNWNVDILTRHLKGIPDKVLTDLTLADLPPMVGAPRTRANRIASIRTFFTWARKRKYLPPHEDTIADMLEMPIVTRKIPSTWTPDELRILLENVGPDYLPWLACAALAGVRTEETSPDRASSKSPLDWSDFVWDRDIIIVRPETAKTGHRRVIPIQPRLREILFPIRQVSGRIAPALPPHTPQKGGKQCETTRLGKLFPGGWRRNALRHSFISYRAALVGLAQTAMEAGNSESEAKSSYNDAKGADEAKEWFGIQPG